MTQKPLSEMKVSEKGIIVAFESENKVHERLREMGLVTGTLVKVKRFAPLGDPMEITVRGYSLSIRKSDARGILMAPSAA